MCVTPASNMCAATRLCLRSRFRGGLFISHGWSTGGTKSDCVYGVVGAGCRSRHGRSRVVAMTEPKTVPEMLDAAETGEDFGAVILGIFKTLERLKDDE